MYEVLTWISLYINEYLFRFQIRVAQSWVGRGKNNKFQYFVSLAKIEGTQKMSSCLQKRDSSLAYHSSVFIDQMKYRHEITIIWPYTLILYRQVQKSLRWATVYFYRKIYQMNHIMGHSSTTRSTMDFMILSFIWSIDMN